MTDKPHIYIVAAEKSGDELGAKLAATLKKQTNGHVKLSGIGGPAMQAQCLHSPIDIRPLSIMGYVEALKSYPIIIDRVWKSADLIIESNADAVILIDSWGFMIRVAKRLRAKGYKGKIIKYVAPQVWAMREGRSKVLANAVDHLLTIHSFDAPYFTKHGLDTIYVGNPVLDETYDSGDGAALKAEYSIPTGTPVLTVLFGSRLSEIQKLAKPFANAIADMKLAIPDLVVFSPVSDVIAEDVLGAATEYKILQDVIMLGENRKLDCFAAADAALACSGTVTTQLASAGVPSVVGYKLNTLTSFVVKRLFKPDYISIVNIAAKQALMPEFTQQNCKGSQLSTALMPYFQSPTIRDKASNALLAAVKKMRKNNKTSTATHSSVRAANAILKILEY